MNVLTNFPSWDRLITCPATERTENNKTSQELTQGALENRNRVNHLRKKETKKPVCPLEQLEENSSPTEITIVRGMVEKLTGNEKVEGPLWRDGSALPGHHC